MTTMMPKVVNNKFVKIYDLSQDNISPMHYDLSQDNISPTAMQCNSNDPHLKQRVKGKFKGREVHILNYIMNTVFSSFPYQYKSRLN